MALQVSLLGPMGRIGSAPERRFLGLFLPHWPTDYLKRRDANLKAPLALYERIKGGLRLAAIDAEGMRLGLRQGMNLADARALVQSLTVLELDRPLLEAGFADFADWHSNLSPLVSVLADSAPYGDLMLDITGVSHLFGGEAAMLRLALTRLRALNYSVAGAIAPTIGAAWAVSHFARSQVLPLAALESGLDVLPVHALRLDEKQVATLVQMGLDNIGQLRNRPRKPLQARFGASLLTRLDQAYGLIEERMAPRLPMVEHAVERRFADPIALLDDVLAATHDLAVKLACHLEQHGLGAQSFHLFLYRVDHKVMTLSLNASRLTRDPAHITGLFRHRAQRLQGEYDAGFGIDMVRLAVSSTDRLDAEQKGAFAAPSGLEDIDRLLDRLGSRLGSEAVLRSQSIASHVPERAARLVPAVAMAAENPVEPPPLMRPLRLLPQPEPVMVNAEVPDGLPGSMVWRRQVYRLVKAAGPERIGAEWWRSGQRLALVPEEKPDKDPQSSQPIPYIADLPLFDPEAGTRDYYVVEDEEGRRFWLFRLGLYGGEILPSWYLHGFFP
ncbi:DNA polymerase Y family protein [Devosia sp. YIM 151766]|uniref:Y-family DNA polymerase n=1 Tax=Devosia sp. YIM 151766 TaxID=3017325 RepID=UPI00255CC335|nr:DNA polymerase Y family protein [Devosia sp. YIM 151766]WIY52773.1 DNA polymerase Y family protein [Devosia sp. YIM 151766]